VMDSKPFLEHNRGDICQEKPHASFERSAPRKCEIVCVARVCRSNRVR
jgi:hypothetical protein